ncbi:unnamed protein product [Callosobruchus maculatus]|nr:unnamed protein product [Callosobruchus maculatus]
MSDVGGMEMKGHMLKNYLFNVNVIILVYDITDCDSFDNMAIWIEKIKEDVSDPLIAVFANKCDLEHKRAVRLDKTKKFIEQYGLHNFLMSARTGENVNTYLTDIIAKYFGITLSKSERERRNPVVTAEIIPASLPRTTPTRSSSKLSVNGNSICSIQ